MRVEVQPGQPVQAGQTLLVMEAMKMEHRLVAPCSGRVAHLQALPGQQVAARHLLVQIETMDT